MKVMLKGYLRYRAKMKQLDLPEVDFYIKLKYPQLNALLTVPEGSKMPFHLKEHCERQYNIMNRLQRRYKDLAFKEKGFFFTNQYLRYELDRIYLPFVRRKIGTTSNLGISTSRLSHLPRI